MGSILWTAPRSAWTILVYDTVQSCFQTPRLFENTELLLRRLHRAGVQASGIEVAEVLVLVLGAQEGDEQALLRLLGGYSPQWWCNWRRKR